MKKVLAFMDMQTMKRPPLGFIAGKKNLLIVGLTLIDF
jgi:hypothetical protein